MRNHIEVSILSMRGRRYGYFGYDEVARALDVKYVGHESSGVIESAALTKSSSKLTIDFRGPVIAVMRELAIPDTGIRNVALLARRALEVIAENRICNVIISSPPHSTQVVGLTLRRRLRDSLNLIVDYRDSWNTRKHYRKRTRIANVIAERQERQVLRNADHILCVSEPMVRNLEVKFRHAVEAKTHLVMNGFGDLGMEFVETSRDNGPSKSDRLQIGYFGSASDAPNSNKNPERLLRAIEEFEHDIALEFYGTVNLRPEWIAQLGDRIKIHGSLPHKDALRKMREYDVLLVIDSESEGAEEVVTGKLFEYMSVQKPILILGPNNMEAIRIVKEQNIGYTADIFDEDQITSILNKVWSDWRDDKLISPRTEAILPFHRQEQYRKLLEIIR